MKKAWMTACAALLALPLLLAAVRCPVYAAAGNGAAGNGTAGDEWAGRVDDGGGAAKKTLKNADNSTAAALDGYVNAALAGRAGSTATAAAAAVHAQTQASASTPDSSFIYRFQDKVIERQEYEERLRQAELEARLAAEEERRLEGLRAKVAILTEAEINEIYPQGYFVERMKELGYYKQDFNDDSLNYRNAVIRLQADKNMRTDAVLGEASKKALVENSPVIACDEIAAPASDGFWITINKTKNILTVYQGAQVYHKYPVATGASPSLTPEGKFSFVTKSVNPAWGGGGYAEPVAGGSPSNPLGKRWFGLSIGGGGRYGVHGNASPRSIGTYASHGCVRMINTDVESMFEYVPVGTPVWIGTEAKLAEFGIKQYYTVTQPAEPLDPAEPLEAAETEPGTAPAGAPDTDPANASGVKDAENAGRAILIALT